MVRVRRVQLFIFYACTPYLFYPIFIQAGREVNRQWREKRARSKLSQGRFVKDESVLSLLQHGRDVNASFLFIPS